MQPFKMQPVYKDYLWGGNYLRDKLGKKSEHPIIAESWELASHPDGSSLIASGPLKGMSFSQFFADFPEECGVRCSGNDAFPILVKRLALAGIYTQVLDGDSFCALICLSGKGELVCDGSGIIVIKGETVFIPASQRYFSITGEGEFLLICV